jgi:hypothetical protein
MERLSLEEIDKRIVRVLEDAPKNGMSACLVGTAANISTSAAKRGLGRLLNSDRVRKLPAVCGIVRFSLL